LSPILGIWASQNYPRVTPSYESIQTVTVGGGGSATVSFTSIPSTFKHLQVRYLAQTNRGTYGTDNILIRLNSDTAGNYSVHSITGDGASVTAGAGTSTTQFSSQATGSGASTTYGAGVMDLLEYANTNIYKTSRILSGADHNGTIAGYGGQILFSSGGWRSTSAVTTIQFRPEFGSAFTQYSQFALYGIKG
jgi:hypothetical protein